MRDPLTKAGRQDLIGNGCDCLIPSEPPPQALEARRERANDDFRGEFVHTVPKPGYRPGRKTAKRRVGKR